LKEHEYIPTQEDINKTINEWIYKTMYNYYYWETELPLNPNYTETPDVFFKSLLFESKDHYSWINENKQNNQDNQDMLNGINDSFGFEYVLMYKDVEKKKLYGIIQYVISDSPASKENLKRGDMFFMINKEELNTENYHLLLAKEKALYTFQNNDGEEFDIELVIASVNESPVYFKNIYEFENQKVGYLIYNLFAEDSGDGTQSYLKDLLNAFVFFKYGDISEFILDLRYNSGGSLDLAVILSSLLVPNIDDLNVALKLEYNSKIMAIIQEDRTLSEIRFSSFPESYIGNNLKRLYVIVSGNTASSSEALINCLKPYMQVILIGTSTYGKNYSSIMFFDEKRRFDWVIQPIVSKISNCNGESDYDHGFIPDIYINELNYPLVKLGDIREPLFSQAILSITGDKGLKSTQKENEVNPFYYSRKCKINLLDLK
jgi:C-terminal processing protease CtpA/Prc